VGNFTEAEKWAERAAELAEDEKSRRDYTARAEQYRDGEPLRVTPKEEELRDE